MILVVGTPAKRGFPQHNLLGDGYNSLVRKFYFYKLAIAVATC